MTWRTGKLEWMTQPLSFKHIVESMSGSTVTKSSQRCVSADLPQAQEMRRAWPAVLAGSQEYMPSS